MEVVIVEDQGRGTSTRTNTKMRICIACFKMLEAVEHSIIPCLRLLPSVTSLSVDLASIRAIPSRTGRYTHGFSSPSVTGGHAIVSCLNSTYLERSDPVSFSLLCRFVHAFQMHPKETTMCLS